MYGKCFHKGGSDIQEKAFELEREWLKLELERQGLALEAEGQGLATAPGQGLATAPGQGLAEGPLVSWTTPLEINDVFPTCQIWQNTRLSRQVLIILVDRCHLNGGIKEFILQLATDESQRIIGEGDDEIESALKFCQSFLQRYEKGSREDEDDDEEDDEEEEDEEEEEDVEQISPTTSPHRKGTGPPRRRNIKMTTFGYVEMAREAHALLTAGFRPSKQPYLAKKLYELQNYRLEKMQAKPRLLMPETEYFAGVPDCHGLLEEGQVLIHVNDGITPGAYRLYQLIPFGSPSLSPRCYHTLASLRTLYPHYYHTVLSPPPPSANTVLLPPSANTVLPPSAHTLLPPLPHCSHCTPPPFPSDTPPPSGCAHDPGSGRHQLEQHEEIPGGRGGRGTGGRTES